MSSKKWTQIIREDDCIKMVLEFLANRDLCISQLIIERETGEFIFDFFLDFKFFFFLI